MIQFDKIYDRVTSILASHLPEGLVYHNLEHTKYVLDKATLIAEQEKISSEDFILVKIAALYHDIGFIKSRDGHEETGCIIAENDLLKDGFSKNEVIKICGMIMATKIPQSPKNLLEEIVADADLEYLGTDSFDLTSEKLFEELKYFNQTLTKKEWYKLQVNFLSAHKYHTQFCIEHRNLIKLKNLNDVTARLQQLEEF